MLFVDLLAWWYSRGWTWILRRLFVVQNSRLLEFFSLTELLKTLFAPFRQDAVETKGAPIGVKLQVLGGNIISRFFGFFIRVTLIFVGLILIVINSILSILVSLLWPLVPVAPILAVVFMVSGVGL